MRLIFAAASFWKLCSKTRALPSLALTLPLNSQCHGNVWKQMWADTWFMPCMCAFQPIHKWVGIVLLWSDEIATSFTWRIYGGMPSLKSEYIYVIEMWCSFKSFCCYTQFLNVKWLLCWSASVHCCLNVLDMLLLIWHSVKQIRKYVNRSNSYVELSSSCKYNFF